jgi:flavin reductase (DIM6/NTAB) family NADH-FMN oxidoreductase RutF
MKRIDPAELSRKDMYKLMTGSIVPRPIAWVSSVNADGQPNLAPFSYFTAVSPNPPTVIFCPGTRGTDGGQKDTYHNVKATGEFVINFVSESVVDEMNISATELPPQINEFERAGLTPIDSELIKPPRVKESPIQWECKLHDIVTVGDGHIVIGTVLLMHFDEAVHQDNNYVDIQAYQPIGRLAGGGYTRVTDLFNVQRLPSEIDPE